MSDPTHPAAPSIDVGLAILTFAALRANDKPTAFTVVQTYREVESAFYKVHDIQSLQSNKVGADKTKGFSVGTQ